MAFEYGEEKDANGNITHPGSWGGKSPPSEAMARIVENFRILRDEPNQVGIIAANVINTPGSIVKSTDVQKAIDELGSFQSFGSTQIGVEQTSLGVEVKGRTLVNLIGKGGNFEIDGAIDGWSATCSVLKDTANKKYGDYCYKIILNGATCQVYRVSNFKAGKYYVSLADVKVGDCASISNRGLASASTSVTSTNYTCSYWKFYSPIDQSGDWGLQLYLTGSSGQYGYVDGYRVYEIDQATYNKIDVDPDYTGDKLAAKFPYIDSVQFKSNTMITATATTLDPQTKTQAHIPIKLADTESVYVVNDKAVYKQTWAKDVQLSGDLAWAFNINYTGMKLFAFAYGSTLSTAIADSEIISNYKGSILIKGGAWGASERGQITTASIFITAYNTDSGFIDGITPTSAEIKAYFYGWKMCASDGSGYVSGTKYWKKITDGTGITPTIPTASYSGYTPYVLHYKLATPVTHYNYVKGDITKPILSAGSFLNIPVGIDQIEQTTGVDWSTKQVLSSAYSSTIPLMALDNPTTTRSRDYLYAGLEQNVAYYQLNFGGLASYAPGDLGIGGYVKSLKSIDIRTVKVGGRYFCNSCTNTPTTFNGYLDVLPITDDLIAFKFTVYNGTTYECQNIGGNTWTPWSQVATTNSPTFTGNVSVKGELVATRINGDMSSAGYSMLGYFNNDDYTAGNKTFIKIRQKVASNSSWGALLGVDRDTGNVFLTNDDITKQHISIAPSGDVTISGSFKSKGDISIDGPSSLTKFILNATPAYNGKYSYIGYDTTSTEAMIFNTRYDHQQTAMLWKIAEVEKMRLNGIGLGIGVNPQATLHSTGSTILGGSIVPSWSNIGNGQLAPQISGNQLIIQWKDANGAQRQATLTSTI